MVWMDGGIMFQQLFPIYCPKCGALPDKYELDLRELYPVEEMDKAIQERLKR